MLLVSLTATPPSICCSTFSLALIFIRGGGQPCRSFWFSGAAYTRLCMVRHYGHLEGVKIASTPEEFVAACDAALELSRNPESGSA